MIEALCDYANRETDDFEHPTIKAIALHCWLALIHPFADGNGRTARALFYLFMLKNDYWLFEYLSISRVILRRRAQYERSAPEASPIRARRQSPEHRSARIGPRRRSPVGVGHSSAR